MSTENGTKTIAFVLYEGLTPFDLIGPLQVLTGFSRLDPRYQVTVVSERVQPLESDTGVSFMAEHSFDDVPNPFALVVPGGGMPTLRAMSNPAIRKYVRTAAETAEIVGSVCTGALILASVGLLEGRPATTHWAYYKTLERLGARYQRKRWVQDGKFIMSAGVSAGIDMALYLVSKLADEATTRQVQLDLQYDPKPPFGGIDYDRIAFKGRVLRAGLSLAAPIFTFRPKRLARNGN